jgi:cell division protein FtsI (penicillin-binding protein 3)
VTATKVNTRKQILIRARIIFGLVAVFGIYIIVSIVRLQNGMDPEFDINLEKQNTRISTVYGIRGNIYADNGALLATSVPTYDVRWDSKIAALTNEIFYQKIDSLSLIFART